MTPAARLQAAAEILDEVIVATRDDGPPADTMVTRYFKHAAMPDRRTGARCASLCSGPSAVPRNVRRAAAPPFSGLPMMSRNSRSCSARRGGPSRAACGAGRGSQRGAGMAHGGAVAIGRPEEWGALLDRAPLDLRVNVDPGSREQALSQFPDARRRRSVRGAFACRRRAGLMISRLSRPGWSKFRTREAS